MAFKQAGHPTQVLQLLLSGAQYVAGCTTFSVFYEVVSVIMWPLPHKPHIILEMVFKQAGHPTHRASCPQIQGKSAASQSKILRPRPFYLTWVVCPMFCMGLNI